MLRDISVPIKNSAMTRSAFDKAAAVDGINSGIGRVEPATEASRNKRINPGSRTFAPSERSQKLKTGPPTQTENTLNIELRVIRSRGVLPGYRRGPSTLSRYLGRGRRRRHAGAVPAAHVQIVIKLPLI